MPAKVVELKGGGKKAVIEQLGQRREVFNNVVNAKVGEFVLLQQGFIVERIARKEAMEALKTLDDSILGKEKQAREALEALK